MRIRPALGIIGLLACLGVAVTAAPALATGFSIFEFSSRGNGMGATGVATADTPSALALNPAGITQLDGIQAEAGVSFIAPTASVSATNMYTGQKTNNTQKDNTYLAPHAYFTAKVDENVTLGIGFFSRFGLGSEWEEGWAGRYNIYDAMVESYSANPNIAIKVTDTFSVAFGAEIMKFDLDLKQKVDATKLFAAAGALPALSAMGLPTTINDPSTNLLDVDQKISGDAWGLGATISVHHRPADWISWGLTYRSPVQQSLDGSAEYQKTALVNMLLPNNFYNTNVTGKVTLPDMFLGGVAFHPVENLTIEVDAVFTRWSTYDSLDIRFDDPTLGVGATSSVKDWKDTWRFQFGVEYLATDWLALRGGYVFDQSPIPDNYADYIVPTSDYHIFSAGLGFKFLEQGSLDLSYMYVLSGDRDYSNRQISGGVLEGELSDSYSHIFGISLGWAF